MLSLTRPWHARPMVKQHPHIARALLMAKEYLLITALFLILSFWIYPVFQALFAIYNFNPSFMVRYCLLGTVFLSLCYVRHWVLIHTSEPLPIDSNGQPIRFRRVGIDPNLVFDRHREWRAWLICRHGCLVGWVIGITITAVYSLAIAQLALWRLLLEEQDSTPVNTIAHVALTGTLIFMVLHLAYACYSMSRALAGHIGQMRTPLEHREGTKVWSGLWHAGSYLL